MFLEFIRVKQYYKNLLVFLVLIFAGEFFNLQSVSLIILGFISLCLISSTNYILNDIFDVESDKKHSEKKKRAIASGKISVFWATIVAMVFAVVSLVIAWYVAEYFFYLVILLFLLTQVYTLFFKNEIFLDVLFIAVNFVLRAVSGALILHASISPWLVLCAFFLSLFLAVGKRRGDLIFLGTNAVKHKKVLGVYTKELLDKILIVVLALLFSSYSLYSFLRGYPMLVTLPVALYCVLRYLYLIEINSSIIRSPDRVYKDWKLLLGIFIWVVVSFFMLYFYPLVAQSL
ncbi:MAG: UbiA family prenyltransferase [archaeon]